MDRRQILSAIAILVLVILLTSSSVRAQDDAQNAPQNSKIETTRRDFLRSLYFPAPPLDLEVGGPGKAVGVGPENSLLDTFSLSFVGNFNFANAIEGIKKIVEGIASCEYRSRNNFRFHFGKFFLKKVMCRNNFQLELQRVFQFANYFPFGP